MSCHRNIPKRLNASNEQRTFSGPVKVQLDKDKAAAQQRLFPLARGIVAAT